MCESDILAAPGWCLLQLFTEFFDLRLQRLNEFGGYSPKASVLGQPLSPWRLLCSRRYRKRLRPIVRTSFQPPEVIRLIQPRAQLPTLLIGVHRLAVDDVRHRPAAVFALELHRNAGVQLCGRTQRTAVSADDQRFAHFGEIGIRAGDKNRKSNR